MAEKHLTDTFYRIAPESFHFLKFILEGYDNLAMMSSISNTRGIIRIRCALDSLPELITIIGSVAPRIKRPCL